MERSIVLFVLMGFIGINAQKLENNENQMDCFTSDNFTLVKTHILRYGKTQSAKETGGNMESETFEAEFKTRQLKLDTAQQQERIIVTYFDDINQLPSYLVSNEKDILRFSAYYSRFDTEEDVQKRKEDWCRLVSAIIAVNIPDKFLEYLELGNSYWRSQELVKAQKAYQKFVDLMKDEGLNDQIPQLVRDRLFKCRLRKY